MYVFERFCRCEQLILQKKNVDWHCTQLFSTLIDISLIPICSFPGLQHIAQDERVSMGTDGNLYFSNALQNDSRQDYCCFASFHRIRTIVQKSAVAVVVKSCKFTKYFFVALACVTVAQVFIMPSRIEIPEKLKHKEMTQTSPAHFLFFSRSVKRQHLRVFSGIFLIICEMFLHRIPRGRACLVMFLLCETLLWCWIEQ